MLDVISQSVSALHTPTASISLPSYLQITVNSVLSVITPSLIHSAPPSSVLLLGPPSSGKSLVTTRVVDNLHAQLSETDSNLHLLHLNGLLHVNPLKAWRHVARQLSTEFDDETISSMNVQSCLGTISDAFRQLHKNNTPILMILDAFDQFVISADGMSQTVLYSLFNYLQDRTMRIAVIAMTSCIDVSDGLEKRVKSRFNHRTVIVHLPSDHEPVLKWISQVLLYKHPNTRISAAFTRFVKSFLGDPRCITAVKRQLSRSRVVSPLLSAFEAAITCAFEEPLGKKVGKAELTKRVNSACEMFVCVLQPRGSVAEYLQHLTALEIAFLICLRKLEHWADQKDGKVSIVFSDVFEQYRNACSEEGWSATKKAGVERHVADKSWERLVECGLVIRTGHGPRDMRSCFLGVSGEEVDKALQENALASEAMKNWAKKRW